MRSSTHFSGCFLLEGEKHMLIRKINQNINIEIGNKVTFLRNSKNILGVVKIIRDNSVVVEITKEDQLFLNIENEYTVVNHKNYRVVN